MNELLAIIIIVVACCAMFLAWLVSMATCPDKMVNLISGSTSSEYSSSQGSKELIVPDNEERAEALVAQRSSVYLQLNASRRTAGSKKLSMVPEADEQLTVTSTVPALYPSILKPHAPRADNSAQCADNSAQSLVENPAQTLVDKSAQSLVENPAQSLVDVV